MEKPLFEYKNRLRNILAICYWISIALIAILVMVNSNLIRNSISIIIFGIVVSVILWQIKRFKTSIYLDTIVFKEKGFHPLIKNDFGVAFDNIYEYRIKGLGLGLSWIILKRRNGKTIRKLFSFSENELSGFLKILHEKVNTTIS